MSYLNRVVLLLLVFGTSSMALGADLLRYSTKVDPWKSVWFDESNFEETNPNEFKSNLEYTLDLLDGIYSRLKDEATTSHQVYHPKAYWMDAPQHLTSDFRSVLTQFGFKEWASHGEKTRWLRNNGTDIPSSGLAGVGANALITRINENEQVEVLLTLPANGRQELRVPGGSVERGETTIQTVIREMQEELGIEVLNPKLSSIVETVSGLNFPEDKFKGNYLSFYYQVQSADFEPKLEMDPKENRHAGWYNVQGVVDGTASLTLEDRTYPVSALTREILRRFLINLDPSKKIAPILEETSGRKFISS